ncbi:MAG: PAS domain S-box protein [Phycisphaeraceae bacterium JB051]
MFKRFQIKLGISSKIAILVCSIAVLSVVLTSGWVFYKLDQVLIRESQQRVEHDAHVLSERIEGPIRSMCEDVAFLHDTPPITGIIRTLQAADGIDPMDNGSTFELWKSRLTVIFSGMIQAKPYYRQIRFIGVENNGREMVRVDRQYPSDEVAVIGGELLQEKAHRSFYKDILAFPVDQIYLSEINLNWDYGKISQPHLPVLRAAKRVVDEQGKTFGFVIINMDMRYAFNQLNSDLRDDVTMMMTNTRGDFLLHPDPVKTFGFDLNQPHLIQEEFPDITEQFQSVDNSHWTGFLNQDHPKKEWLAASLHKIHFDPSKPDRFLGLLLTSPRDKILESFKPLQQQIFGVLAMLLLVAVAIGLFYSRSLIRPLMQIIEAIDSYGKGNTRSIHVANAPADETGVLLQAFQHMVFQVEKRNNDLRFSEARNRAVLEAAADSILTIDEMGVIQSANTATEELFGYQSKELVGKRIETLMPSPHREMHDSYLAKYRTPSISAEKMGESVLGRIREISGLRKDGTVFPIELSVSRTWINQSQLFTGIIRDVTERKQAEAHLIAKNVELEQKNKEAEQFTYSVSHDLKSPLVSCTGLLSILWEDLEDGDMDGVRKALKRIDSNVDRMYNNVSNLLEFCKVGRIQHEPQWVDMNQTVANAVEELELSINEKNAQIQVQSDLFPIYADPNRMNELFVNLLSNALKYGCEQQQDCKIEVGCKQVGEELFYYVRDFGQGIDPAYHEKIFTLFQRLELKRSGSGVGLAIVRRIMEIHDGRVWVESNLGQGATFWLAFPKRDFVESTEQVN